MSTPMEAMQICVSTAIESDTRSRAEAQARFHQLLVGFDVFLELAREELAHLVIQAVDVRHQRQQRQKKQQQDG